MAGCTSSRAKHTNILTIKGGARCQVTQNSSDQKLRNETLSFFYLKAS